MSDAVINATEEMKLYRRVSKGSVRNLITEIQSLQAENTKLREACTNAANTIGALDEECHGCDLQINKLRRLALASETSSPPNEQSEKEE